MTNTKVDMIVLIRYDIGLVNDTCLHKLLPSGGQLSLFLILHNRSTFFIVDNTL